MQTLHNSNLSNRFPSGPLEQFRRILLHRSQVNNIHLQKNKHKRSIFNERSSERSLRMSTQPQASELCINNVQRHGDGSQRADPCGRIPADGRRSAAHVLRTSEPVSIRSNSICESRDTHHPREKPSNCFASVEMCNYVVSRD